jgi:hypothetical protein
MSRIEQLLTEIEASAHQLITQGAEFGPLVGSQYRLPARAEWWTWKELDALQSAHEGAMAREEALGRWWGRVKERRAAMLDDVFTFQRLNVPANVRREALALDPEQARQVMAEERNFRHPTLALAGDTLFEALCRLVAVSRVELQPGQQRVASRSVSDVDGILACLDGRKGHGVTLAGGVLVGQVSARHRCLSVEGPLAPLLHQMAGATVVSFTARKGDAALRDFLTAYHGFVREALLASVTIGVSVSVDGLTLESRPVEGLAYALQNTEQVSIYQLEGDLLCPKRAFLPRGLRTTLPEDATHREGLVDAVIVRAGSSTGDCFDEILLHAVQRHAHELEPLVEPAPAPLTPEEERELMAMAQARHPTLAEHVCVEENGRYRVTRHDLCHPIHILDTDDLVFALRLALAHHVDNPMRLGLTARAL